MIMKHLARQRKLLEDGFRQYGVEGEDAFYLLAFQYVIYSNDVIQNPPERIMERGQRAFDRVKNDKRLMELIGFIVSSDSTGENLPTWYQHFLGRRFREGSGKFFTPQPIACAMAKLIPRKENAVIMDPTCGGGTFLLQASKIWGRLSCHLVANDIEVSLVDLAQIVLHLGTPEKHKKSFMSSNIFGPDLDFQAWYGRVDYVLANPPFSLQIDNVEFQSKLYALGYRNSDALFLDICLNLLRDQGRLVCLLPHSIIANSEYQKFRSAIEESWDLLGVIGMPEGIFNLVANTTTRADIAILEKRETKYRRNSKMVFAFAPSAGVPLNSRAKRQKINYLEKIVNDPDLVKALGINKG